MPGLSVRVEHVVLRDTQFIIVTRLAVLGGSGCGWCEIVNGVNGDATDGKEIKKTYHPLAMD